MVTPHIAAYGSWKSPITPDLIASRSIALGQIILDGQDIYWAEGRPSEGGRNVIVRRSPDGTITDMLPAPFNARTRVHEYGGGSFTVSDGTIYCSNFDDNRLYRVTPGASPEPLTPAAPMRYADIVVDQQRGRLICVREDHSEEGQEATNTLVSIVLDGDENGGEIVAFGNDFYASPRLSPNGRFLAWLTWNHPNMPWDGCELWVGTFEENGQILSARRVAGDSSESIFQPEWSPKGVLHFISERSGWWNLYRWRNKRIEALCEKKAEFGVPQWIFGLSTYGFVSSEQIICWYSERSIEHLASLNTTTGQLDDIEIPYTKINEVKIVEDRVVLEVASPTTPRSIVQLDLTTSNIEILRRANDISIDSAYLSIPEAIEFPTEHGQTAYGFFYAPHNQDYSAPSGELPPLLVKSHGGPTSSTSNGLSIADQFWTSRGFAILDVNYGGSTGYGRAYRERLKGQWGIVDVDDCVNGAKYLVERGLVDGQRLAIKGGSAGGYTTLCALVFRNTFKAGASHFGVSDLVSFTQETHKYESHYLGGLIGPYPAREDLYQQRSPINFVAQLDHPVIFFQGLDDKVVLPDQAVLMVEALRARKIPVAYIAFEGEGHGFRRSENIKRALEAELYFYARIFGFELAEEVEPVTIDNLNPPSL